MIPVNEKAEAKAQEMLERVNAMTRPVDLKPILDNLGLELMLNPMAEGYSGYLAIDKRVLVVNKFHPPVRRRFTIAHEIGHYDLHRREQDADYVFLDRTDYFRDGQEEVYFRSSQLGAADYRMEVEANAYAAALLMPEKLLEQYLEQNAGKIDLSKPEGTKRIAQAFNVSRLAMGYRLSNLGLAPRPTR